MNWKKRFSFPTSKKAQKKVLDELQQINAPIDADEVTGGRDSTGNKPEFDWIKLEIGGGKKKD